MAGLYTANVATASSTQIARLRFRGDASNSRSTFWRMPVVVGAAGCSLVSDRWLPDFTLTDMSTPETLCSDSQTEGIVHGAGVLSGRSSQPSPESVNSRPLRLSGVPDTLENRQAGIFRKGGIGFREFTTIECRSAIRLNSLCVHAIEAQPYAPLFILGTCGFRHILQDNVPRNSHHAFRYTYRFHTNST
jgi:hypothetical protein